MNRSGGDIYCAHADGQRGSLSLLYNGHRVKGPGRGVDHPSPSSVEVAPVLAIYPQHPLFAPISMARGDLYLCLYFALYSVPTRATRYELNSLWVELR